MFAAMRKRNTAAERAGCNRRSALRCAWLAVLLLAACPTRPPAGAAGQGGATAPAGGVPPAAPVRYIATVTPVELILEPLVRGRASVAVLLPPGASAHTYEPRPGDAQAAGTADALFWIGADYDGFAAELQARHSVELLALLPERAQLPSFSRSHDHGAAESQPGNGAAARQHAAQEQAGVDPHFFTDPLAVQALLPALTAELARLDPAGRPQYEANAAAFSAELQALHAEAAAMLAPVRGQATLLFHPSFRYLFRRYGIELTGVIEEFPGKEPSPKYLQELARSIRSRRIRAIFSETLLPRQPAAVIAEATGVPVLELDPGCGASAGGYASYADWLLYNARILRDALADEPGA